MQLRTKVLCSGLLVGTLAILYACVGSDPDGVSPAGADASSSADGSSGPNDAGANDDPDAPPCVADLGCVPANTCQRGRTRCEGKATVCAEVESLADGTECGPGAVCRAGACSDPNWAQWTMPSFPGVIDGGPVPTYPYEPNTSLLLTRDSVTNLLWTVDGPADQTWAQAKAYCDAYAMFGADWRLPTAIEVVSIGDVSVSTGFASRFGTVTGGLWSSTPVATTAGQHWAVNHLRTAATADTELRHVRCVR